MKKVIALCLSAILIICAFCACGQITEDKTTPENSAPEETAPPATKENTTPEETTLPAVEENTAIDSTQGVTALPETNYFSTKIKESPDKYTWYIKNYVGRNCATFGNFYGSGYIRDFYGEGSIKIIIITEDGTFVDDDTIEDYVVIEQSVEPNTELKYVFETTMIDDEEYERVESQNIEEMEILVRRVEGA